MGDIMIINGKKIKAKDFAKMAGVSRKTIVKYYAMPREQYEKEAAEKRQLAFELRSSGLKWREVAEKMDTTLDSAMAYYRRHLALQEKQI